MGLLSVDPTHPEPARIQRAADALREGRLVAFPTETVYGLGAHALDPRAIARIYAAKGRPSYNPLIVHVLDADHGRRLTRAWPALAEALCRAFWPGPLTLVLPKRPEVPDLATAGLPSVALRAPAHPVARALLEAADLPIAAPSANRSQGVSPTTAAHVLRSLGARAPLILDAGPSAVGIESTVLDLCGARPVLLRPGGLPIPSIEAVVGPLLRADAALHEGVVLHEGVARPSPGMLDRHYAPGAALYLLDPGAALSARLSGLAGPVGLISHVPAVFDELDGLGIDHPLSLPADPEGYARTLYAALHTLDELDCATILITRVPALPAWAAIADRLERAAR